MNKKLYACIFVLIAGSLSACSFLHRTKKETPKEMIKNTQVNIIKAFKSTALAKHNVDYQSYVDILVNSPMGGGKATLSMAGKSLGYTGDVNLSLNGNFDVKYPKSLSGNVDASIDLKTTLKKIYIRLSKLNINVSDPQLGMYTAVAQTIVGKWFYVENGVNQQFNQNMMLAYKNLDLEKIFKNNSIFKVNKVLKDNEFKVSLDKDSLVNIIYKIRKQLDKTFNGNIDDVKEIKQELKNGDIKGDLKIGDDKYFEFSGNIINNGNFSSIPLLIVYKKDKFKVSIAKIFDLDLDRKGDKFNGKIYIKAPQSPSLTLPISGLLNEKEFKLSTSYYNQDQVPIKLKLSTDYKINKQIKKLNLQVPSDAVSPEQLMGGFTPALKQLGK